MDHHGTGSILDVSSACLESQNKTFRDYTNRRSYRGSTLRQTSDVLRTQYLRGTFQYAKEIQRFSHILENDPDSNLEIVEGRISQVANDGNEMDNDSDIVVETASESEDETDTDNEFAMATQKEMYNPDLLLQIPYRLFEKFEELAKENTNKDVDGLETMAYMFGHVDSAIQRITHLVLMKQMSTHSSCEPTDEGNVQIAEFSAQNPKLTICGWSHTHPKFDSYFSSVDCHTHCNFLNSIPHFIGHVYSGVTYENRILTLTKYGMDLVGKCNVGNEVAHEHSHPCGDDQHEFFQCPLVVTDVVYEFFMDSVTVVDLR